MDTGLITIERTAMIPTRIARQLTPVLFSGSDKAERRFWEFFTANIRNPNTRMAYLTAAYRFADWCEVKGLALRQVEPMLVAAYIEQLTTVYAPATVKQYLAAIRMLFDWLVVGQVVPFNPANSVRGPRHVVKTGKTPVLTAGETRALLDAIDTGTLVGVRDRALIGLMVYSFARVSAALAMRVADYYTQGKRSFFRLHEKGGKYLVVPAHHVGQAYIDEYLERAGIDGDKQGPLFRSSGQGRRQDVLLRSAMTRQTALKMIKRRARNVGLPDEITNHSFRGPASLSICATAVIWKPPHVSPVTNRPVPRNSITACTRNCRSMRSSGFTFRLSWKRLQGTLYRMMSLPPRFSSPVSGYSNPLGRSFKSLSGDVRRPEFPVRPETAESGRN